MSSQPQNSRKISVSIAGMSYQLVSNESEKYILDIAHKTDQAIKKIIEMNPSLSGVQATVLAMINAIDALDKITSDFEKANNELEKLKINATSAKQDLYMQREMVFEQKKEILRLNNLNKQLILEIAALRQNTIELTTTEETEEMNEDTQDETVPTEDFKQPTFDDFFKTNY